MNSVQGALMAIAVILTLPILGGLMTDASSTDESALIKPAFVVIVGVGGLVAALFVAVREWK